MNARNTKNMDDTLSAAPEQFVRQVIFMKDDDKILAVFPFYHRISDEEYNNVSESFFETLDLDDVPDKNQFCLMYELEFGWGWIYNKMIPSLEVAEKDEYEEFKEILVKTRVINPAFVLNEDK